MGSLGAWVAERVFFLFGVTAVLLLPLLYIGARKLWREVEEDEEFEGEARTRWWRPLGSWVIHLTWGSPPHQIPFTQGRSAMTPSQAA